MFLPKYGTQTISIALISASVLLPGGFFLGGLCWTIFICGLGSHGRKRAGTGLLRACHVLSALLFAYFSYSVIVNGYRDLIVQTSQLFARMVASYKVSVADGSAEVLRLVSRDLDFQYRSLMAAQPAA